MSVGYGCNCSSPTHTFPHTPRTITHRQPAPCPSCAVGRVVPCMVGCASVSAAHKIVPGCHLCNCQLRLSLECWREVGQLCWIAIVCWTCIDEKCSQCLWTQHTLALRPCPVQSLDDMKKTMGLWMNTSIAIFKDPEANKVGLSQHMCVDSITVLPACMRVTDERIHGIP